MTTTPATAPPTSAEADVIIVGAGPGGSTAAYHLAQAGLDVLLLEKTEFPRDKVCGDGLTPRAVKQLVNMGIDVSTEAGWLHNKGLRIMGAGHELQLHWPDVYKRQPSSTGQVVGPSLTPTLPEARPHVGRS